MDYDDEFPEGYQSMRSFIITSDDAEKLLPYLEMIKANDIHRILIVDVLESEDPTKKLILNFQFGQLSPPYNVHKIESMNKPNLDFIDVDNQPEPNKYSVAKENQEIRELKDDSDPFWSLVDRSGGDNACRPWLGDGYIYKRDDKSWAPRFLAYYLVYDGIPDTCDVLHRCANPDCCNPAHLYLKP